MALTNAEGGFVAKSAMMLLKEEGVTGSDPTPTVGSDAVVIEDVTFDPLGNAESMERAPVLSDAALGRQTSVPGKRHSTWSFSVPVVGTENTGSEALFTPDYDPLMSACACKPSSGAYVSSPESLTYEEQAVATTCTSYFIVGPAQSSDTNRWMQFESNGMAGNFKLGASVGEFLKMSFDMAGTYVEPVAIADPGDPTLVEVAPNPALNVNFIMNFGGSYQPCVRSFEFDLGNDYPGRETMNGDNGGYKGFLVVDRAPKLTWTMELDLPAADNIHNHYTAGTIGSLSIGSIGTVAGNIIDIDFGRVSIDKVSTEAADGLLVANVEATAAINVSDLSTKAFSMVIT